jgi:hypothetical protein
VSARPVDDGPPEGPQGEPQGELQGEPQAAPQAAVAADAADAAVGRVLDAVLARYTAGRFEKEAVQAREDWLERTGRVYDDEESYEARMAGFQEWFALHRPLGGGRVPAERYLMEESRRLQPGDRACLRAMCRSQWALFQALETEETHLTVQDLWRGGRFEVMLDRDLPGVEEGDTFEARVVGLGGVVRFTRAFLFHPGEATPAILAHVEAARGRGEDLETVMFRLAQLRLRCDRYRSITPAKVYGQTLGRTRGTGAGP